MVGAGVTWVGVVLCCVGVTHAEVSVVLGVRWLQPLSCCSRDCSVMLHPVVNGILCGIQLQPTGTV